MMMWEEIGAEFNDLALSEPFSISENGAALAVVNEDVSGAYVQSSLCRADEVPLRLNVIG